MTRLALSGGAYEARSVIASAQLTYCITLGRFSSKRAARQAYLAAAKGRGK